MFEQTAPGRPRFAARAERDAGADNHQNIRPVAVEITAERL